MVLLEVILKEMMMTPLSIRSLSITSLGIIFAFLTIFLPSISILIGRPLTQGNEIIHNHDFKKDGP